MANFVFGRGLDYLFSPLSDGDAVPADSLTSARIYTNAPTEAQIENTDTGHVEEVLSWTDNGDNTYTISFAALTDSTPHNSSPYENYYTVVNFVYTNGAAAVFDETIIRVYRPNSWAERISVTNADVENLENKMSLCFDDPNSTITAHICDAKEEVLYYFEGVGYEKAKLIGLDKLNLAVKYKATEMGCRNAASEDGQFWFEKADYYAERYDYLLQTTKVMHGDDTESATDLNVNSIYLLR